MTLSPDSLKEFLEITFSMPFDVRTENRDGTEIFISCPQNDGFLFFDVVTYISNSIRIVIEIRPQLHAGALVHEMNSASTEQIERFLDYTKTIMKRTGVKFVFSVNGNNVQEINPSLWSYNWRTFSCRITKIPIIESESLYDVYQVICEWTKQAYCLIFSLLTISEKEPEIEGFVEGSPFEVRATRYERNPINRELCLSYYGYQCRICGLDFRSKYGPIGQDFIHVHHIIPVSKIGKDYKINPIKDLIPVCPNCHAMLHRQNPPFEPDQLKKLIDEVKKA